MFSIFMVILVEASTALQPFSFRGLTTETTEEQALGQSIVERCKKYILPGVRQCWLRQRTLAGYNSILASADFKNNKMVYVGGLISSSNFDGMEQATKKRYGNPCITKMEYLILNSGNSIKNRVIYWCFSDGAIQLKEHSVDLMTSFRFYAKSYDDIIARSQPKIDF
jgi:hypothetical protein